MFPLELSYSVPDEARSETAGILRPVAEVACPSVQGLGAYGCAPSRSEVSGRLDEVICCSIIAAGPLIRGGQLVSWVNLRVAMLMRSMLFQAFLSVSQGPPIHGYFWSSWEVLGSRALGRCDELAKPTCLKSDDIRTFNGRERLVRPIGALSCH